jgi:ribose transport system substrate-binding protein
MSFIKNFVEQETMKRRQFLLSGIAGVGTVAAAGILPTRLLAADDPTIAWSYRNRTNPYWNAIVSGGTRFVESLGKSGDELVHLLNEGSSEKSLADVKALLSKTGGKLALGIDANDAPNARPVVEACAAAGGHLVTIWNKTDDLHPWDFGDNYVAHISWSDVAPATTVANILIDAMGGSGGIVGLGGIPSNNPAIERRQGLDAAMAANGNTVLLDYQAADWDTQKAAEIMSSYLTRFGNEIKGVFCANDTMAFGAIEALRAEGLAGQIPVVGYDGTAQAAEYIRSGEMEGTVYTDPPWAGGIACSLAYHAAIGAFKPSDEPKGHREFFGPALVVSKSDVDAFIAAHIEGTPDVDWKDFWGPTTPAA